MDGDGDFYNDSSMDGNGDFYNDFPNFKVLKKVSNWL